MPRSPRSKKRLSRWFSNSLGLGGVDRAIGWRRVRRLGVESLEDRRMLAVTAADVAIALESINNELDEVFNNQAASLFGDVPILASGALSLAFEDADLAVPLIANVQQQVDQDASLTAATEIENAINGISPGQLAVDVTAVNANSIEFAVAISPDIATLSVPLGNGVIALGAFELSLGSSLPDLTFDADLDITTSVILTDSGDITAIPNSTQIVFAPSVNLASPIQIDGTIANGVLGYSGSLDASFAPTVALDFGVGTSPVTLEQLAGAANVDFTHPNLTVPVQIELDASGPLPELGYNTVFTFDSSNGAVVTQDNDQITIAGDAVGANSEALITFAIQQAAGPLFDRIGDFIPTEVAQYLLGQTELFTGLTVSDLLEGVSAPLGGAVDTPIDLLQLVGVPGPVIAFAENFLQVSTLADTASSNPIEAAETAEDIGVVIPLISNPIETVVGILAADAPVDLVTWNVDVIDLLRDELGLPANAPNPSFVVTSPTGIDRIQIDTEYSLSGAISTLLSPLPESLQSVAQRAIELLGDVSVDLLFEFQAGIVAGVDTTFLFQGPSAASLADSFFIEGDDIIDFTLDARASISQGSIGFGLGVPTPPFIEDAGNAIVECASNVGDCAEEAGRSAGDALSDLSDQALDVLQEGGEALVDFLETIFDPNLIEVEAGVDILLNANLSLNDPDGDGSVRASEVVAILQNCGPLGLASLRLEGELEVFGEATVVGQTIGPESFRFPSLAVDTNSNCLQLNDRGGPGADGAPEEAPFAELLGNQLFVYGSAVSDVFFIEEVAGSVVVQLAGESQRFNATDVSAITVDLRGSLAPSNPSIVTENGGNDVLTIDSSLSTGIEVTALGGIGNDLLTAVTNSINFFGGAVNFFGGPGNDTLIGSGAGTELRGEGNDDILRAGPGQIAAFGGEGADSIEGLSDFPGISASVTSGLFVGEGGVDFLAVGTQSQGPFTLIGGYLNSAERSGVDEGSLIFGGLAGDLIFAGDSMGSPGSFEAIPNTGGDSVVIGGPGSDTISGTQGDDVLLGGALQSDLGDGFNDVFGFAGDDTIATTDVVPDAVAGMIRGDLATSGNGRAFGGPDDDLLLGGGNEDFLQGDAGDDTVLASNSDDLTVIGKDNDNIDGGAPNTSDVLFIDAPNANQFTVVVQSEVPDAGTVFIFVDGVLASESTYVDKEVITGNFFGGPFNEQLLMLGPDEFEQNDTPGTATNVGVADQVALDNLVIQPRDNPFGFPVPSDEDWFRFVAPTNGTLDFRVLFDTFDPSLLPGGGDLNIEIYDSDGQSVTVNPLATGTPLLDGGGSVIGERATITAIRGESYLLRVFGASSDVSNGYSIRVDRDEAQVPQAVDLRASSDTGRNNTDDITLQSAGAQFDIFVDDDQLDAFTNLNLRPDTVNDDAATANFDYGVEVFNNGVSIGFAFLVGGNTWRFSTTAGDLNEGDGNQISAAVWIRDPADPPALGRGELSTPLQIELDTVAPPVSFGDAVTANDGLAGPSDTGVVPDAATRDDRITSDTTPTFFGQAEANAIVRVFADVNNDGAVNAGDLLLGQTVATPLSGNNAFADGFWEITSTIDLNEPSVFTLDGQRNLLVTAEDNAGNVNGTADGVGDVQQRLSIFLDTQGPRVAAVLANGTTDFDLFDPKPSVNGFTPLINTLDIAFPDNPLRVAGFQYPAINAATISVGDFLLVGDHTGTVAIESLTINEDAAAGTTNVTLNFGGPLDDDRYTLTVRDTLFDDAGNALDGESNATQPLEDPVFPSGDGVPGGAFAARFTVDSRPELGTFVARSISIDANGNFVFDPAPTLGGDATNVDLSFSLGVANANGTVGLGGYGPSDLAFAGRFYQGVGANVPERLFDQLAAYGFSTELGRFRFLVDTDSDGVITLGTDILTDQPDLAGVGFSEEGAIPIAGNFDGIAGNGDEVGLYYAGMWGLDRNRNFFIEPFEVFGNGLLGHPVVGDFDGDGADDLAVFNNNQLFFDFANDGLNGLDDSFVFGQPGVLDRPISADFDQDGVDDIGIFVPGNSAVVPRQQAEWRILVSGDPSQPARASAIGTANLLDHPFETAPFGDDIFAVFGDELALPIVGNFDPPVGSPANVQAAALNASAVVASSGDYDQNGVVNTDDYRLWRGTYGSRDDLRADGNRDGLVDGADYSVWRDNLTPPPLVPASVQVALVMPGDYDANGRVDTTDYQIWRRSYGGDNLSADGNGDGSVDAADYSVWRDRLGATAVAFGALQETSVAVIAASISSTRVRNAVVSDISLSDETAPDERYQLATNNLRATDAIFSNSESDSVAELLSARTPVAATASTRVSTNNHSPEPSRLSKASNDLLLLAATPHAGSQSSQEDNTSAFDYSDRFPEEEITDEEIDSFFEQLAGEDLDSF